MGPYSPSPIHFAPPPPLIRLCFHSCLVLYAPCSGLVRCSGSAPGVQLTLALHRGRLGRCGGMLSGVIRPFIDDPIQYVSHVKVRNCFKAIYWIKLYIIFGKLSTVVSGFSCMRHYPRVHWRVVGTIAGWLYFSWEVGLQRYVCCSWIFKGSLV